MTAPKFALNEVVFAKLKGYAPWPAKVEYLENSQNSNKVKYIVYFYGTNQIAVCKEGDLCSYTENRKNLGKPKKIKGFLKAISQAESELQLRRKSEYTLTHLDYLKAELQVLMIDLGIKNSLNIEQPDLDTCLKLLDEYSQVTVTPLMFKKNPSLIDTLLKVMVYSNYVNYGSSPDDEEIGVYDEDKINLIKRKARKIFYRIQSVFVIPQGKTFLEQFANQLLEFHRAVKNMPENELLELSEDPAIN